MDDVRQTMERLNQAWRNHRFEELHEYFDDNIVMHGPELKELVRGRERLVQSYVDFMGKSQVTAYSESNYYVHQWQTSAVVGYDWSMTWVQNGKTDSASGKEMFVFELRGVRWVAVLRVMLY
jgi:hypothetical protein